MPTVIIVKPYRICNPELTMQNEGMGEATGEAVIRKISAFDNGLD